VNAGWRTELEEVIQALDGFALRGRVLELAGGTGIWTKQLAQTAAELTVVDASPEMLGINRDRVRDPYVRYITADLFEWQPETVYDVVFFGFWLSHVPPEWSWSAWFKSHYIDWPHMPDTFELAKWKVDHNALLLELIEQRRALGERVYREAQNKFQVRLSGTITLGGKPDLVTVAPDGSVRIFDAKTGSPKTSDQVQMMLYLFCLPSAFPKYKGQQIDGCVVYASGVRAPVPCEAVTPDFKTQARQFINLLDSDVVPDRAPSPDECRYCDITPADCSDRVDTFIKGDIPDLDW